MHTDFSKLMNTTRRQTDLCADPFTGRNGERQNDSTCWFDGSHFIRKVRTLPGQECIHYRTLSLSGSSRKQDARSRELDRCSVYPEQISAHIDEALDDAVVEQTGC